MLHNSKNPKFDPMRPNPYHSKSRAMKRVGVVFTSSLLVFAALFVLAGCSGLECADGTVEQDGECVMAPGLAGECEYGLVRRGDECIEPEELCGEGARYRSARGTCMPEFAELSCGEGSEPDGDRCVAPEPVECGDGTHQLDPRLNECVPSNTVCSWGTVWTSINDEEYQCVPSDEACGDNTVFVEETRLCMPAYDCRPGDVVIDGHCVPEAMELAEDIEYEAQGNTNPEYDGDPVAMDLSTKDLAIFGGTIDAPTDLNDDGELDQVIDFFAFEAQEGDWLEISVQSLGIPNPAFAIVDSDGNPTRFSTVTGHRDKMRQVTITEDGVYLLAVLPEMALVDDEVIAGDSGWDYVGTVERISTPSAEAQDFEAENVKNSLGRLDDNFYVVDQYEAGAHVELFWESVPSHADPVVTLWASEDEFLSEHRSLAFGLEVPESGEFYVVFDWDVIYGTAGLDYEVSTQELVTIPIGESVSYDFTAEQGDVLRIYQDNYHGDTVELVVTDEANEIVLEQTIEDLYIARYVGLEAGEYTATFANPNPNFAVEYFSAYIQAGVQKELTNFDITHSGRANEAEGWMQSFYAVEFDEKTHYEITLRWLDDDPGFGRIFVYGMGDEQLLRTDEIAYWDEPEISAIFEFEADTPYFLRIGNDDPDYWYFFDYELSFEPVEAFEDGAETSVAVTVEEGDKLVVSQDNYGSVDMEIEILDDDGNTVHAQTLGAGEEYGEHGLEAGDYTVNFTNESQETIYHLEAEAYAVSPTVLATIDVEVGDVVEIDRYTASTPEQIDLALVDEDSGESLWGELFGPVGFSRYVGVEESGQWSLVVYDEDPMELAEYELSYEVIVPELISDTSEVYEGEASDADFGEQDFYSLELEETTTYDVTLTHTSGFGWGRVFIYTLGDDQVFRMEDYVDWSDNTSETISFEFEADTHYIIRVGNDIQDNDLFEYQLTFE